LKSRAEELLCDLIMLRSTSEDDVRPIVEYVSSKLRKLGLEPRYLGEKDHPAIVAQLRSGGVALSGHLDTVPVGTGWDHDLGECVGGVMHGRGSCDMKGGCAAILLAAEDMVAANVPFSVCFTTDEETTMHGAKAAAGDPVITEAPVVLIAEPSDFEIVVKEKGLLQFSISTKGHAVHASMPQLGDNAIVKMVRMLTKIEDLQKVPPEPDTDMTMCVDVIRGGTKVNVIPADCEAEIDVRYPPDMSAGSILNLVKERIGTDGYDLKVLHQLDPVEIDAALPAVATLRDLIGPDAKVAAVPYATEMVMFKKGNDVLMVCGPGDPKRCHTVNECIDIPQVVKAAELYTEFCTRMAK